MRRQISKPILSFNGRQALLKAEGPIALMRRALQMHKRFFLAASAGGIESVPALMVMRAVAEKSGQSHVDIRRSIGMDRSTMSQIVTNLEKAGYLVSTKSEDDARNQSISITPPGSKALKKAELAATDAERNMMLVIPPGHHRIVIDALAAMADASTILNKRKEAHA